MLQKLAQIFGDYLAMFIRHCYLVQTIVAPFWGNCWKHLSCFLFHHLVTLLVTAEVGNMLALLRELDVV